MKYYISFFILLLIVGCTKDNGNYDYSQLNDVSFVHFEEEYRVTRFENIKIVPNLEFSIAETEEFDYLWYIIDQNEYDTISRERNLNVKISLLPKSYDLVYKVIDRKTGIFYKKLTKLSVEHPFQEGFIILGKLGDNANICFVNSSDNLYKDIYYSFKNEFLCQNPQAIWHVLPSNPGMFRGMEYITVIYDDGKAKLLHPVYFLTIQSEQDIFSVKPDVIRIDGYVQNYWYRDFIINNGQIHHRRYTLDYGHPIRGNYEIPTQNFCANDMVVFYDNLNMRFIYPVYNYSLMKGIPVSPTADMEIFDPNNVGLKLVYASPNIDGYCSGIFKDELNLYVLRFSYVIPESGSAYITPTSKHMVSSSSRLKETSPMVTSDLAKDFLIFAEGSKLYSYNLITNTEEELYDFGADYEVKKLFYHDKLVVGLNNSSATDRAGEVCVFNITLTGGFSIVEENHYTGITDEIVDIAYKYDESR